MLRRSMAALVVVGSVVALAAQTSQLPADIHPESLSRLPPIK